MRFAWGKSGTSTLRKKRQRPPNHARGRTAGKSAAVRSTADREKRPEGAKGNHGIRVSRGQTSMGEKVKQVSEFSCLRGGLGGDGLEFSQKKNSCVFKWHVEGVEGTRRGDFNEARVSSSEGRARRKLQKKTCSRGQKGTSGGIPTVVRLQ